MTNQRDQSLPASLRSQVFKGGGFLAGRQAVSLVIGVLGPVYLLQEIGPSNYGLYAAVLGIVTYTQLLSQWGIEVYLIRHPEGEDCPEVYHQAFTLLVALAILGMGSAYLALPLLNQWMRIPGFHPVAGAMGLSLPLMMLKQVPLAKLERELDYKRIVVTELGGQVCFYLVALPLAFRNRSVWAPVAGWWCQQALIMALLLIVTRYRPYFCFNMHLVKRMLSYGLGYSTSVWIYQLRALVNPLVVGHYAGGEAVGFVALAVRVVEALSFAKGAAGRISIAALARLQDNLERLTKAIAEGTRLQMLMIGPPLAIFAGFGSWVLARVFGPRWIPAMLVYPFIALGYLSNSGFVLSSSSLYVLRRNWDMAIFHAVHIILFAGSALVLVPRLGIIGYGWAEAAALPSYWVLHYFTTRRVGRPEYALAAMWWLAFGLALFEPVIGWPSLILLPIIIVWPSSLKCCVGYARDAWAATHGR